MPNLISQRPARWSDVVGQQRAIDVLQAVLRNQNFLTRGIILYGVLGVGKLLDVDELIPTLDGFVRNGDLQDGDKVFGEDGQVHRVVKAHPIVEEEAFKVTFDDGTFTHVHAGHLWHTYTLKDRQAITHRTLKFKKNRREHRARKGNRHWSEQRLLRSLPLPSGSVKTTAEIAATLKTGMNNQINHSIRLPAPAQIREATLSLDPYVLGAWLGDGHSSSGRMTCHRRDADELLAHFGMPYRKAQGDPNGWIIGTLVRSGKYKSATGTLTLALKKLGVLENKHIPNEYLWASSKQRLALLQGLMDTDGCCVRNLCEFTNMNKLLAEGVYHLAASLGLKPFWNEGIATLNGKNCGIKYRVTWTASLPVFRLKRKLDRLPKQTRLTQDWRYITSVQPTGRMKMRCITVDNPSGLYLFGRNFNVTHNTTTAYLVAKALMCTGSDPLGCGECPSCMTVGENGIDQHPDFTEVDGAQKSGAEAARETVEVTLSLPVLGRRKVTVIDEAQFLSDLAWGAYLKVLEQGETESVFIFVSNEVTRIKQTTTSRCIKVPFERVGRETMVGLLSKVATDNGIDYDLSGLDAIARHSHGIIRDAVQWLNTAAALGEVKPETVRAVIDTSLEDKATKLMLLIARKDQAGAAKLADELGLNFTPQRVVEAMLGVYGRSIWQGDAESELKQVYIGLPNVAEVTSVLVKWSGLGVPADVLPIVVFELLKTQQSRQIARSVGASVTVVAQAPKLAPVSSPKSSLSAFLGDDDAI